MSQEKSLTESEAKRIIEENERKIDTMKKDMKKKEKKKDKEDDKKDNKEGFIGTNTDKNRNPTTRAINALIAALNILAFVLLFLYIPAHLWIVLTEYKKIPGYSSNQVAGTDPFKPPYVKKAPPGVKSPSLSEMGDLGYFSTKKHGWPYTWAQASDDVGEGDFIYPQTIWANHVRDMFLQARNMFDGFLDIYKSIIGKLPPALNPKVPDRPQTWWETIKTFFGVFWVAIVTVVFLMIGTGQLAQKYIGVPIGIPYISLIYATIMIFTDAFRMKECKDKSLGFLFSKIWWHTGDDEAGWFAAPMAKIWRLLYRGILVGSIFTFNMVIAMYILPLYGIYWLFGRSMPETSEAVWYILKKLVSKYFLPITIFVLLGVAQYANTEMYPASFKVSPAFWKGGPRWRGSWKNIAGQSSDWYWALLKKIGTGWPYALGTLVQICVFINIFKKVIPFSGAKPKLDPTIKVVPSEFTLPKEEQWAYSGPNHLKYGAEGWKDRWMKQIKEGLKLQPPCGDGKSKSSPAPAPSAQGMVFDSVMKAASKEPLVKQYKAFNQIANNPSVQNKAAMGAIGAAALSAGMGGPVGSAVANQALRTAMRGGKKNKNRRKR